MSKLNTFLTLCNLCCTVFILKQLSKVTVKRKVEKPPIKKTSIHRRGPVSFLEYIPTNKEGVFTYQSYLATRRAHDLPDDSAKKTLNKWKSRGYIRLLEDGSFKKLRGEDFRIIIE